MKKTTVLFLFILINISLINAQRFAYIDTEYIMDNIPEYKAAQMEIEEISKEWEKEVEAKFQEVDRLYREYQAEAVLLPDDIKREREETIIRKEREAKELQMKRFGPEGDLFVKRQELIRPIQDRIFEAVEEIAKSDNYAVIFDKTTSGGAMIFTDVQYDLSDKILEHLGYRK